MLNLAIGSQVEILGKTCIQTYRSASGHAVYGPYLDLEPGHYVVEFNLHPVPGQSEDGADVCATVDVAADFGRMIFARQDITIAQLATGPVSVQLAFEATVPHCFEFRAAVRGNIPLLIEDYCRVMAIDDPSSDYAALLAATRFPNPLILPKPAFFLEHQVILRRFYEAGAQVKIVGSDTVVVIDGVSFFARVADDLRFIEEIFHRSTYNVLLGTPCCVIDIGMNIGLVALTFARKDCVREVHSFEPFKNTYARACENLRLNPDIAGKITANNFGLAGSDDDRTILIADESDSGAFSIRGSDRGTPEAIAVRNAATTLKPIIEAAAAKGLDVIAKVDCEGSEFSIFEVLEHAGLLGKICAFMVEWHRGNGGKTQRDLIEPLLRHGFVAFDQSTKTGNGFFYAARISLAAA